MDRSAVRRRLGVVAHDGITWWSAWKESAYRGLSKTYRLPEGAKRVYCHHIRKTAGTSLHFSFLALGGEDPAAVHRRIAASALHRTISGDYAFAAHNRRVLEQGAYLYGWSHLPAHRISLRPRTFTVTILRDPCDRVVSHYNYVREGDQPGMAFAVTKAEQALASQGFTSFLEALPKKDLLRQLFTFSPTFSVGEAAERIAGCSCVMYTETYESGLQALAQRLELPLASRRDRATKARDPISGAERERLREILEPEYDLLRRLGVTEPGSLQSP
jgi:hypothetical protein